MLCALKDFVKRYTTPGGEARFFSRSHVFIAFRTYLANEKPREILSMDFDAFGFQLDRVAEDLQLKTKKMGRTTYIEFFVDSSELLAPKVHPEKGQLEDGENMKIIDINIFLCCKICCGYLVDATTITECLHSFCKSCILKHFLLKNFCPVCGVTVHSTNPVSGLKADTALQDIVNKLLPGITTRELHKFAEFEEAASLNGKPLPPALKLYKSCCIYLEWVGPHICSLPSMDLIHKYIRLPNHTTIAHIAQFVCNKLKEMDWKPHNEASCIVQSGGVELPPFLTLQNILEHSLDFESKKGFMVLQYDFKLGKES